MWVRRAESDLRIAELALAAEEPVWDAMCFHSHACAEKMIKALIVSGGWFPPRTHDLAGLIEAQPVLFGDQRVEPAAGRDIGKVHRK